MALACMLVWLENEGYRKLRQKVYAKLDFSDWFLTA
jgi:hypothetical protein